MVPLQLSLSGFLSYHDPVELDFNGFDLACISGANGAGKSSLLDAITWALFGQARKRDDSLINLCSDSAEVVFTFAYEANVYRVQRTNPRGKTSMLEFFIRHTEGDTPGAWKPLTERTLRETQARLEETLRMDYETFVNASFFLQGKADQFTQQRSSDRKRILSSILGLEVWEGYRQRAAERRKAIEFEIATLDGRLADIQGELSEEEARRTELKRLEAELKRLSKARLGYEKTLESQRQVAARLEEQRKLVEVLARQLQAAAKQLDELETRVVERRQERETYQAVLSRAEEIQAKYQAWQKARQELEAWEVIAARFREQEKRRQTPLDEINALRARLIQERETLQAQEKAIRDQAALIQDLEVQLEIAKDTLAQVQEQKAQRTTLEAALREAQGRQAEAKAENPRLKAEMDELKERIDQLVATEGAECPTCGQPLAPDERQRLVESLSTQGKEMGDRYRANQSLLQEAERIVVEIEGQIADLSEVENALLTRARAVEQLNARLEQMARVTEEWERKGAARLVDVEGQLDAETFAAEARQRLAEIDAELKAIGYDAAAHDATRSAEAEGRAAEAALRALEKAQSSLAPLERELAGLETQIEIGRAEVDRQGTEHTHAAAELAAAQAGAPDLQAAEREVLAAREDENRLRMEVGAAQQRVAVLADLKGRREALQIEREALARQVGQYKQLERAFGKDGVPALLIEQALPQIEAKANELLDRLSDGNMSVRFITQASYKDKRREDLRETLDIQISDSAGIRDYEMFSGGEAFRVNFAIRLALSEVLAQRAGARLQTLVIDEGFGSQDAQGRQRLIEAINLVRPDFAKILVITHIDELKEAFPTRIEVQKSERGSTLRVI